MRAFLLYIVLVKKPLITKSLSLQQTNLFASKKISYDCLPFMSYRASNNDVKVNQLLKQTDNITWVFTSRRAVKAIQAILKNKTGSTKILTVGQQAADLLNHLKFKVDYVGKTSEDLLSYFSQQPTKGLNYFRGRFHRNTIPAYCKANNVIYNDVECYYALANNQEINISRYDSIWIFSPINAKIASEIEGINLNMPVYCIGPVTENALQQTGFTNIFTPETPSFENVMNLYLIKNQII